MNTLTRALFALVIATGLALPSAAHADEETSKQLYAAGKRKYNLGEFERAIDLFKQAYDEHAFPEYLYNIAFSYKQLKNCEKALFFFERFLSEKPEGDHVPVVQKHIDEHKARCGSSAATGGGTTGDGTGDTGSEDPGYNKPDSGDGNGDATGDDDDDDDDGKEPRVGDASSDGGTGDSDSSTDGGGVNKSGGGAWLPRPLIAATAEAGFTVFNMGDVVTPVAATLRIGAAYPMTIAGLKVEPGIGIELHRMTYEEAMGTSSVIFQSFYLEGRVSVDIMPALSIGGELGLGLFRFSGLKGGNPFLDGFSEQYGSASSFSVRLGATAEYAVLPGLTASASPAFAWAGADDSLREPISSVTRIELIGGLRYRW